MEIILYEMYWIGMVVLNFDLKEVCRFINWFVLFNLINRSNLKYYCNIVYVWIILYKIWLKI